MVEGGLHVVHYMGCMDAVGPGCSTLMAIHGSRPTCALCIERGYKASVGPACNALGPKWLVLLGEDVERVDPIRTTHGALYGMHGFRPALMQFIAQRYMDPVGPIL